MVKKRRHTVREKEKEYSAEEPEKEKKSTGSHKPAYLTGPPGIYLFSV